jgi:hypothetical protein
MKPVSFYAAPFALALAAALLAGPFTTRAQPHTERQYLSGKDKDDTETWDFKVTGGRRAGEWATIPVPSQWELEGFGSYSYGRDSLKNDQPRTDEEGIYRHRFTVPEAWEGRDVRLVFRGVMTDARVWVNGERAGPVHRGAFYPFSYEVGDRLQYGEENKIRVRVSKRSSDASVNRAERFADYWTFGGIFRPVYLEARPPQHVERVAMEARADGRMQLDAHLDDAPAGSRAVARVQTLSGEAVGAAFSEKIAAGDTVATLRTQIDDPETWTPEDPDRYQVRVRLKSTDGETLHETHERFGFRTVELREQDGVYVNGEKVRFKGVNRHEFWPESGRATSRSLSVRDAKLIKEMNMNAVVMSHYPPGEHFLTVADSLGLFVIDELAGWQEAYDTDVGERLVRAMVVRDVNHPSVVLWANGNEGGWNEALDDDFARYDPQNRPVVHPWATHDGINTDHYRNYGCCAGSFFHGRDVFMPTEFLHGLYDGGHAAGLQDWWNLMLQKPRSAGGFLWALLDEAVVRTDLTNEAGGDTLDTRGNWAPDGLIGPYRESKEASFYAIKQIWSPVYVRESEMDRLPPTFDGTIHLENRYEFTNLDRIDFTWKLLDFPGPAAAREGALTDGPGASRRAQTVAQRGEAEAPSTPPDLDAALPLGLPSDWQSRDALALTATDPDGREIYTWTWMIASPRQTREQIGEAESGDTEEVSGRAGDGRIRMQAGETTVEVDASTGRLASVRQSGEAFSLSNGPRPVGIYPDSLTSLDHYAEGDGYVVEATYDGGLNRVRWRLLPSGWLRLDYAYRHGGKLNHAGVTFDYPEEQVEGVTWLGRGPYRVWKNRRAGMRFSVWQKDYNDTRTGLEWTQPEFKGHHADVRWARLDTREGPITVATDTEDLFLRLFTPDWGPNPKFTDVAFPAGDLSFLHGIAPIGTKFRPPPGTGPSGRKNDLDWRDPYTGTLYFHFGESPAAVGAR